MDPHRPVEDLRQALQSGKRPLGILLGAGGPLAVRVGSEPLIPAIAGMTSVISDHLRTSASAASFERLIEILREDGNSAPNLEELLGQVRAMRVVARGGAVRGLDHLALEALDREISEGVVDLANVALPGPDTAYADFAEWVGAIARGFPVEIFTTNYDLLVEQALEEARVPYFDGFLGGRRPFFDLRAMEDDELPSRWARVWKLHGSVNWCLGADDRVVRTAPPAGGERRLIHPSHLKYDESRRMPYLAMIDRLRTFLRSPSALLVLCGYSFGDDHLNEVLVENLQANSTAMSFGLLHGPLAGYSAALSASSKTRNLALLARDAGVVGGEQAQWGVSGDISDTDQRFIDAGPAVDDQPRPATSRLGDFAQFARFLVDLTGNR